MANVKKLLRLADVIEHPRKNGFLGLKFNLADWFRTPRGDDGEHEIPAKAKDDNWCGTVACIAGFQVAIGPKKAGRKAIKSFWDGTGNWGNNGPIAEEAKLQLGLTEREASSLFTPGYYEYTAKQAAKVIRHFANTGRVDWNILDK